VVGENWDPVLWRHGRAYRLRCAIVLASRSSRMGSSIGSTASRKISLVSSDIISAAQESSHGAHMIAMRIDRSGPCYIFSACMRKPAHSPRKGCLFALVVRVPRFETRDIVGLRSGRLCPRPLHIAHTPARKI
jgi:hypothetical protein